MGATQTPEAIDHQRRRFAGVAAVTIAAAQLGGIGSAQADTSTPKPAQPALNAGTHTSFASLKQIDAGVLNVGYAEAGPRRRPGGPRSAWLALRHLLLCRCRADLGVAGLSGDHPACAALVVKGRDFVLTQFAR